MRRRLLRCELREFRTLARNAFGDAQLCVRNDGFRPRCGCATRVIMLLCSMGRAKAARASNTGYLLPRNGEKPVGAVLDYFGLDAVTLRGFSLSDVCLLWRDYSYE